MARNSMVNPELTVRELREAAYALAYDIREALGRYEKKVGQYPNAINIKLMSHYTEAAGMHGKVLDAVMLCDVEIVPPSIN